MGKRCTVLSGLTIRNGSHGVYLGSYARTCELRNCVIYNNAEDGVYCKNGYYKFHNCLIYENSLDGIRFGADPGCIVTKCTIANNGEDGMEIGHLTDQVIDSIIVRNDEDGIQAGAIAIKYCDVWDNAMNDYLGGAYPGEGTISEDPLLCKSSCRRLSSQHGQPVYRHSFRWREYGLHTHREGISRK